MQIHIGSWKLATGLDWRIPTNSREVSEAKRDRKDNMFVLAKHSHMSWLGFHEKATPGTYAAAILVGLIKPNAVVLHAVSETTSWVCYVRDGMPVAGRDLVLPHDEANKLSREWYGRNEAATLIGEHRGASIGLPAVLAELQLALDKKAIPKSAIRNATLKTNGIPARKAVLIAGVGIAMGGLALTIHHFASILGQKALPTESRENQRDADTAARVAALLNAKKVNAEVLQREVSELQSKYSKRVSPIALWNAVSKLRSELPVSQYGYRPTSQNCSTTICTVSWSGQGTFVRMVDKLRLPNVEANYSSDFSAISKFSIQAADEPLPELKASTPLELQFMLRSEMALRYPSAQVGEMKEINVTPPPGTGLSPVAAAHAGTWSIQLTGPTALTSATSLASTLQHLPITLSTINYDKQSQRVEFIGEYVMLPSNRQNL